MAHEWTRYYREPDWHDLCVLHARFREHRFVRHSHDYFVIGYVETGVQAYSYRGARHFTAAGQVFLVNPGEVHTGEAATPCGYVYRTVYPRPALVEQVAEDVTGRRRLPFFKEAVIRDRVVGRQLKAFHREIATGGSRLATESLLVEALGRLIVRYADKPTAYANASRERSAVRRVREYIDANFAGNPSLSTLAGIAGLSRFHLARVFENEAGIPPHTYLEMVRTERARRLLDAGGSLVEVALAVGYADQSHLTHRFKRVLGITPGQYVRASKTQWMRCSRNHELLSIGS
jgi:AraC-like DNA-binding protein